MLVFYRKAFRSGVMVLSVTVGGQDSGFLLRSTDNGNTIDFGADAVRDALLAKYPGFLTLPA